MERGSHAKAEAELQHDLYFRACAGVPAPDCALRADDGGRPHGLRQDDGHQLVPRRKDEGREGRRHPYEHLLGKHPHFMAKRAGRLPVRGAFASRRIRLPGRRGQRRARDGGALPHAFIRENVLLSLFGRFPSPARRARRPLHLPHQRAPARKRASDRCQPRPILASGRDRAPRRKPQPDRHGAAAAQSHGACHLHPQVRRGALRAAAGKSVPLERGLVLGHLSESARAF